MAIFKVPMVKVTVAAAQDIWSIKAGSVNPIYIHEIRLGQVGLTAVGGIALKFIKQTVTVTQGSGGSTPTPVKLVGANGASSQATVHMNDTTASSAGTLTTVDADVFQYLNGFFFLPAPEDRIYIDPATAFILNTPDTPTSSVWSGSITYEELGI